MPEEPTKLPDMPPMGVQHRTLPEEVFEVLADAILRGELSEGEHLNEWELAKKMGISRTPVRDALAELEKQGLVVQVPRKGTFVAHLKKQDLWEVATLRSVLEGLAASLASSNLEPADVHFLEDLIERMEIADQERDIQQLIDLDHTFHSRICKCSNHRRLQRALHDLRLQIRLFMIVTRPTDVVRYPDQHRILLQAIQSQDPERAEQTAIEHVMGTASLALQDVPDDELWDRVRPFAGREQVS